MKTIARVTVIYPQSFQIEIDDKETMKEIRKKIFEKADYLMETSPSQPKITEFETNE